MKVVEYQMPFRPKMQRGRRRSGLSTVELLTSLAIAALLLAATAVAFDAAFTNYTANYEMATVSMSARNALHQMCSTIRSAWNDPDMATIDVDEATGDECSLVDANGRDITYRYDAVSRQMKVSVDDPSKWYVMVDDVYPLSASDPVFSATAPIGDGFPAGTVGQVQICFKVVRGDTTRSVSVAAVPRNVVYNN